MDCGPTVVTALRTSLGAQHRLYSASQVGCFTKENNASPMIVAKAALAALGTCRMVIIGAWMTSHNGGLKSGGGASSGVPSNSVGSLGG